MNYSKLQIFNMALDEVPGTLVQDPNERSIEAQACRRNFDIVVSELLEEIKPRFAITRVALAALTNDRAAEWGFAYRTPANLAWGLGVLPPQTAPSGTVLLAGQTYAGFSSPYGSEYPRIPFERAGSMIYTDMEGAVLEYIADEIDVSKFSPMFAKAVAFLLAERICMPVAKDKVRKRELTTQAEVWRSRAMAAEQNAAPQSYDHVPETVIARGGGIV